ncbi:MBL fold metallo-hydrolase [Kosakonia pseudosacchari]|uniref:MBL fold metallo-hydrolase n=2 Tax=Kosakonia pseudosacchari TaxID=1646340 RepID=A0ABX4IRD0_9ENTR|nr:MBL fold metallo-hydrolase [Kosakonia pseudosacchari]
MTSRMLEQTPGITRLQLQDITVTILSDGYLEGTFALLNGIETDHAEALLRANGVSPLPRMNINACVVETTGHTILIDSGTGTPDGASGELPAALAAAGIDPLSIDTILLTHGHRDHIGGLAGPLQTPLFSNVQRLFVHEKELAFWRDETLYASAPEGLKRSFDIAKNAFSAYDDRLVPFTHEDLLPGIQAVPLFGHTPGHSGFLLGNEKGSLLIWGDIVHFPYIQIARPEVSIAYDRDPALAAKTRNTLLDRVATDDISVCGMHFNLPTTAKLSRSGKSYALHYAM